MMSGRRRLMMSALSKKEDIPVWDGTTVTTPKIVDGMYEIYDAATWLGYIQMGDQHIWGNVTADFAFNANWEDWESWGTTPPSNVYPSMDKTICGIHGNGHSVYGIYQKSQSGPIVGHLISGLDKIRILGVYKHERCGISVCDTLNSTTVVKDIVCAGYFSGYSSFADSLLGGGKNILMFGDFVYGHDSSFCSGIVNRSSTLYNCAAVGSLIIGWTGNGNFEAGLVKGNATLYGCWSSVDFKNAAGGYISGRSTLASGSATMPSECYYDSVRSADATQKQGTPKTTAEIKSQAFVNQLNANIDSDTNLAGCTKWKLQTKGMLAGWPDLDF